ncbi:MAG: GLPGLI family protein [Prevotellaceae bacterium]|jgi:GLPGLI family protein|nr:GLPGLI family protein [Prevotellaceae bacterium]
MKKTLTILAFVFMYSGMNAQVIDTMFMLCQYKHKNTIPRASGVKIEIDTMNLETGKNISKFYSYHNKIVDSLRFSSGVAAPSPYKKTASKYIIYTDYVKNNITVSDVAIARMYRYFEKLEIPKWTIHDETKKVLSHTCQKATGRFRGRDYVAWYALDIPISRGPYKFNGLPGLILEISDTESLFTFECIAIETNHSTIINENTNDKLISKKEYINMIKKHNDNPRASIEELFRSDGAINPSDVAKHISAEKKPYNPIELE